INQSESITHVGIQLHQSFKSSSAIDARIQKGQASLFSVLAIDRDTGFVRPSVLSSLVEKISFPVVLYGAELWHNMSKSDICKVEKFIRLAAKSLQRFPTRTRTDIALGMLGWLPLMSYVEQKKLSFLHNLCTMPPNMLSRQVFDLRLNLFTLRGNKNQLGFIPDIWKVLKKYDLDDYLHRYLATAMFPSKYAWKSLIKTRIRNFYEAAWEERLNNDAEFARFKIIQPELTLSNIWNAALDKATAHATFLVARLWTMVPQQNDSIQCLLCGRLTYDIYKHLVSACASFSRVRELFISHVLNCINTDIGNYLRQTDLESLYCALLGAKNHICFECDEKVYDMFLCSSIAFVSQVVTLYTHCHGSLT
ncbi:MAG: hypothetical protein AB2693_26415, partial [Candidatus Thiodiazotropha sp.]